MLFIVLLAIALADPAAAAPPGMQWVPAGTFTQGSDAAEARANERPANQQFVEGFWIDETEVTNNQFAAFVKATDYLTTSERPVDWELMKLQVPPNTPRPSDADLAPASAVFLPTSGPVNLRDFTQWWQLVPGADWQHPEGPTSSIAGRGQWPVVHVSWDDANAYAAWANKQLPTESQWERDARYGHNGEPFMWGTELTPHGQHMANTWQGDFPHANTNADGHAGVAPIKQYPPTELGLYDMAGNVWEWTADQDQSGMRIQKGGSYLCHPTTCESYRPSAKMSTTPDSALSHTGFRCVQPGAMKWLNYEGNPSIEPGRGRRIVLVAGDEEYRSEEALPMLGRMLQSLGFETIVLLSQNPETGMIDPDESAHIPGLHLIDDADLLILQLRFRHLADDDMKHIADYIASGKPVTGIRTSTHAFAYPNDSESIYADWSWNRSGGFGKEVLGETWVAHHGGHGREATRGIIEPGNATHPVLRGVDDVFGPTDVYAINGLPDDAVVLLRGAILTGMSPTDTPVDDARNAPMHPVAWVRERAMPGGRTQRVFTTTMGAAQDWSSEDLRRLLANSVLWQLGQDDAIPAQGLAAPLIGPWDPSPYGFGGYLQGTRP